MTKTSKQVLLRLKGVPICPLCEENEAEYEAAICFKCKRKMDKKYGEGQWEYYENRYN